MQIAAISYRNGRLQAREQNGLWQVRLGNLETRAHYLDLALAQLLGNAPDAHRAAAKLLAELAEVVEQQEAAGLIAVTNPPIQTLRPAPSRGIRARPFTFGLRIVILAVVAVAAFMLTTLMTAIR